MNILLIANSDGALANFRLTLIKKLVLSHNVYIICGDSPEGSYRDILYGLGVTKIEYLNFRMNFRNFFRIFFLVLNIRNFILKNDIDILHSYTHIANITAAFSIFFTKNIKMFSTVTGLGRYFGQSNKKFGFKSSFILLLYYLSSSRVKTFFFQNKDDQLIFERSNICSNSVLLPGSGVDLNHFSTKVSNSNYDKNSEVISCLMLSRGMKEKGFFEFYEASKKLHYLFNGKFKFIHAGSIDKSISDTLDIYSYASACHVDYVGFIHNIIPLLSDCDIVVHASTYREGIPRSLIESLSMDKFIITCDTVGNRECVINDWNGKFIQPNNVDALVSAILYYSFNPSSFVGRSRLYAEKYFDVNNIDHIVISHYFNQYI